MTTGFGGKREGEAPGKNVLHKQRGARGRPAKGMEAETRAINRITTVYSGEIRKRYVIDVVRASNGGFFFVVVFLSNT